MLVSPVPSGAASALLRGMNRISEIALVGAEAGFLAGIAQAGVGEALNERLLPGDKGADVALRLVQAVVADGEHPEPSPFEFLGACAFHFGYAAVWGAAHALARERLRVPPVVGAAAMTAVIYGLAFSRGSGGVIAGSEPHPRRRTRGELAFQLSVAGAFSVANALIYEWARR